MEKIGAILVIAVSINACKIDNIDGAKIHRVPMEAIEACEEIAASVDPIPSIRAYCESKENSQ